MFDILSPTGIQDLIQAYGLWVLFAVVMLESMAVPMPGETALVTAALYAGSTHRIGILPVVIVAATAAVVGDNIGYLIGRSIGLRLIMRYGRYVRLNEARLKVGQYLFLRHGGKIVFFGRFVAFLRAFAALLAGANNMCWPYFLMMNALGGLCWASLFGGSAYLFGEKIKLVAGPISLLLLVVAIGIAAAGIFFFRRHEKELEERASAALPVHWNGAKPERTRLVSPTFEIISKGYQTGQPRNGSSKKAKTTDQYIRGMRACGLRANSPVNAAYVRIGSCVTSAVRVAGGGKDPDFRRAFEDGEGKVIGDEP